jgi:hypothetical protein
MFTLNLKYLFRRLLLTVIPIVSIVGCSPKIIEQKVTIEQQKSECSIATNEYDYASDSYFNQLDSSLSRLGATIDPGELYTTYVEAQELIPYSKRMSEAGNSKEFWCEKVKPDSILYEVKDHVYLSREDAERSLDN